MVPPDSRRISRVPRYSGCRPGEGALRVRGCHPLRPRFPARSARAHSSFWPPFNPAAAGTAAVWAPPRSLATTWGITFVFFSCGYLDVSVPRVRLRAWRGWQASCLPGCPIREPADQRPSAPPRGFSQLIAPFVASESLGIHRPPFFPSSLHAGLAPRARFSLVFHNMSKTFFADPMSATWRIRDSNP